MGRAAVALLVILGLWTSDAHAQPTVVYVGDVPYYYANDVYYVAQPGGYAVSEPPAVAAAPVAPPPQALPPQAGPAPQEAPGTWYYCESAKAYYPYVGECKEGWRPVPATPPGPR